MSDYPHKCPACTSPAYIGMVDNIECSNRECEHFMPSKAKCGKPSCTPESKCTSPKHDDYAGDGDTPVMYPPFSYESILLFGK